MDFALSEDQQALRDLARKIFEERAGHERLKEVKASEERFDRELWAELARASLLGVPVAEAHGGSGLGWCELALLLEEIGRAVAPVPVYETLVLGALPLAAFGSEALQAEWLPKIASGERVLTAALAESGDEEATARREGKDWRLEGERHFVPYAHVADGLLVPAATAEGTSGLFLVDARSDAVRIEKVETTDEQYRCRVRLDGVRVAGSEVIGEPEQGGAILDWMRARATLGLCALQVGVAGRALEMTAAYTTERRQFDRPIGSFQAVHQRAGDAYVDLQAMKLSLWRAIHLVEHGGSSEAALAIAKYWAAEGGARVTYAAQHLHGGIGVDVDYPVHRYYLWARELGVHLGPAGRQLSVLGEALAAS